MTLLIHAGIEVNPYKQSAPGVSTIRDTAMATSDGISSWPHDIKWC